MFNKFKTADIISIRAALEQYEMDDATSYLYFASVPIWYQ
jgi:hypothetical protein